jgi:hypothetical protein
MGASIGTESIDLPNRWRLETPGHQGWKRTARPDDPDHFLMISADCHCNEGSWPHSAQAVERQMKDLNDDQRAKILGLNAAHLWKFDIDKLMKYRQRRAAATA